MKDQQQTDPYLVREARFVKGIVGTDPILEEDRPHVVFIGRSNVGKSSLINYVLGRKNLVRSSARPGKTTEINFFDIDEKYYFVDMPGYGFARMGEKQREKLRKLILWYLLYIPVRERKIFLVLDAQVGLTDYDRDILRELQNAREQVIIILSKTDKLNQKERHRIITELTQEVDSHIVTSSSFKKKGREDIWQFILGR